MKNFKFKNLFILSIFITILSSTLTLESVQSRVPIVSSLSDFWVRITQPYIALYVQTETSPEIYRVVKFGYNLDLDSAANEDVISQGGLMSIDNSAETLTIVSSDAADDDGSTGAESILISCIDSTGAEVSVTVTMDGTTPVVTTQTCIFVNRATVLSSGSGQKNAGNITITNTSSGDTLAYIPLGVSVTQQVVYYVPTTHRCYINTLYVSADKLSGSDPRVEFLVKVLNTQTTNTEYIIRRELIDTANEGRARFDDFKDQALLPGEIITIEANSDTDNTEVSATVDMTCRRL